MTNLASDVKKARELGLSYGQYKALSYDPHAVPVVKKKTKEKLCPICGKVVPKPRIKFCSEECMEVNAKELKRRRSHEYYLSNVKGVKNG